jgi:hypothetical protein
MSPDHPNVVSLNLRRRAPKPVAESQPADRRQRISTFLKTALQGDLFKGDEAGAQPYIEALKAAAASMSETVHFRRLKELEIILLLRSSVRPRPKGRRRKAL